MEVSNPLFRDQGRLAAALKAVPPAVPSRPLTPAGAGVLLSTADGHLEVAATDREIAIRYRVGAQVTQPGSVVLPARTISDLVALLDAQRVDVTFDEGIGDCPELAEGACPEPAEGASPEQSKSALALQCGRTQAHARGWGAGEFPALPVPAGEPVARVEADGLRDGIGRVVYAASPDPARSALCGTLMQFADGQVTLVAADGFRLALYTVPLAVPVAEPFDLVVPARGMRELQRLAREGQASLALDESGRWWIARHSRRLAVRRAR